MLFRSLRALVEQDAALAEPLHASGPWDAAAVIWAARAEMARTVEDVLARRCRVLFLDAAAAYAMAPHVAAILARELGRDALWQAKEVSAFATLAEQYVVRGDVPGS